MTDEPKRQFSTFKGNPDRATSTPPKTIEFFADYNSDVWAIADALMVHNNLIADNGIKLNEEQQQILLRAAQGLNRLHELTSPPLGEKHDRPND